jgi:hypothetical protein
VIALTSIATSMNGKTISDKQQRISVLLSEQQSAFCAHCQARRAAQHFGKNDLPLAASIVMKEKSRIVHFYKDRCKVPR